ncbi:MAG: hypothetical protein ACR2OC_09760 [Solirubrobacterales bacterium]
MIEPSFSLELASIGSVYDRAIVDTGREPHFLFFVSFLLSWGFIRTSAYMIRAQVSWWPGNVEVGGTHIHHLVWGIIIVLITGWIGVTVEPGPPWHGILAILFGFGTGLTLDEFALWLNLKDVYWKKEGRRSIDAVIVAVTITGIALVGFTAWVDVARDVEDGVFAFVGFFGLLAIIVAFGNLAKEKFGMAILSMLLPPAGLIGAVRYGRPQSLWARLFYRGENRRSKSSARFEGRESPWFWRHGKKAAAPEKSVGRRPDLSTRR